MKKLLSILFLLPLFCFGQLKLTDSRLYFTGSGSYSNSVFSPKTYILDTIIKGAAIFFKEGIIIDGQTFQNFDGRPVDGSSWRNSLTITNCKKVIIRNCNFPASLSCGIEIRNCEDVLIENCTFSNNSVGVFIYESTNVRVLNNQLINPHGDPSVTSGPRGGNFIKFNNVYGAGNLIQGNIMKAWPGESLTEDLISIGSSSGTAASPILISGNYLYGQGGNSGGAVGTQIGDGGGSYIKVDGNFFYNQSGAAASISGGHNNTISNNKVLISNSPVNSVGIYIADYSESDCANNQIIGNQVNVTRKGQTGDFAFNERTDEPFDCTSTKITGNNWAAPLSTFTVKENPFRLSVTEVTKLRKANWFKAPVADVITLPVTWGYLKYSDNLFTWSTLTEEKTKVFELQESVDGKTFKTFSTVPAKGTPTLYSAKAPAIIPPLQPERKLLCRWFKIGCPEEVKYMPTTKFYQLTETDNDGKTFIHPTILKVTR